MVLVDAGPHFEQNSNNDMFGQPLINNTMLIK
jgi:hypothetical protein